MSAPKAHLAKSGMTACGRSVGKLKIAHDLHPAQHFVLLKAHLREQILATVTCASCVRGRYSLLAVSNVLAWVAAHPYLEHRSCFRSETEIGAVQASGARTCGRKGVGTRAALPAAMNRREQVWEGIVTALSWIVALVALACLAIFTVVDAAKRCWPRRRAILEKLEAALRVRFLRQEAKS